MDTAAIFILGVALLVAVLAGFLVVMGLRNPPRSRRRLVGFIAGGWSLVLALGIVWLALAE